MKIGFDCVKCKGRLKCGLPRCPVLAKLDIKKSLKPKKEFKSETAGVFIGWHGYPKVYAGLLSPHESTTNKGPREWVNNKSSIIDVMTYRSSLVNSRNKVKIKEVKGFNEYVQSSALSSKPLSIDVSLKKAPKILVNYNIHSQPYGPAAEVKELRVNDHPRIKKAVQKVHYDTDLKAGEAMIILKQKELEEYEISSILSAGTLGVDKNRKLVPTRWSITATDDTLGKNYIKKLKNNEVIDYYQVFHGKYFGNIFTILLMPRFWSYELIEMWMPGAVFSSNETQVMTDYEQFNGRKKYAENTGGGYYASRLPITEWLASNNLQASALVIRQITKDYYMPLGVWVVREAVRKALQNSKKFNNYEQARTYTERLTGFDLRKSKLIREKQTILQKFI
ncbi:hypothetical protein GF352_04750 [archaeon]|nr:hypothetical protein [archaeon]